MVKLLLILEHTVISFEAIRLVETKVYLRLMQRK